MSIERMIAIKNEMDALKAEYDKLSAEYLQDAETQFQDTKLKHVCFVCDAGKLTVSLADKVDCAAPTLLQELFGRTYPDFVRQETVYKLTEPAKRMLASIWQRTYCKDTTVDSIVGNLMCDDKAKAALRRKLRGISYKSDIKALITYAGMSEQDASDIAYLVAEAAAWQRLHVMLSIDHAVVDDTLLRRVEQLTDAAVVVDQTLKLTLEPIGEALQDGN